MHGVSHSLQILLQEILTSSQPASLTLYIVCASTGAFTLVEAPGLLNIQGMLHKDTPSVRASVLSGLAIDYPAIPGIPDIQVNFAEYDSGEATTFDFSSECPGHLYINGELQQVPRGSSISQADYFITLGESGAIDIQFFDGQAGVTAIRLTGRASRIEGLDCVMSATICLPLNEPEILENAVGLLGTPNGNTEDEWISSTGEILELQRGGQVAYEYCTQNHCIENEEDSLFVHEVLSHQDRYSCSEEFPGDPDLSQVTPEVLELCGEDDLECLLEGLLGGIDGAVRVSAIASFHDYLSESLLRG